MPEPDAPDNTPASRVDELAAEAHDARDAARDETADAADQLREALDRAEAAWEAIDEVRRVRAEIDLLCRLCDLDGPDDVPSESDVLEGLSDLREALSEARRRLRAMSHKYPRDGRSAAPGVMLQRRVAVLLGEEPGTGKRYGRARSVPRMLSDRTGSVAASAIQNRLRELYDSIHERHRGDYDPPRPVEDAA